MLCYRCGSHVPDTSETCATCGQKFDAAARQAAGAARKRGTEGAPYKPGDVVANRYSIQEVVGSGPLGFVFRAQDQAIDVEVALKVIQPRLVQQPEERTQFALSMRVGKKLNHPNLVRVYEEGVDGDRPWFAMQLLEGITLRRMMEQRATKGQLFSLKEVEPLLAQMAAALDGAHRFGPHSNLKPENVFVLPDLLKVTDYGLGLAVPHLPFVQAQRGHRAAAYIAPEYVNGAELDTRMDVYSLGVLMGEMVTGLLPEDGGVPEVTVRHPDLPPAFESLYRRALNQNPLARPKSGGDLHAEFAALVQRHPAAASRPRAVPPTGALPAAAVAARAASKPLPPVPTGMLPIATVPTPAEPVQAEEEAPPPDATQPLDAATLAAILGSNAKALDYITGPEARSVSDASTQQEMRAVPERPTGRGGGRGADAGAAQDPRLLGQAPDAATQQEPRAAAPEARPPAAKAAEPVMRIFAKAEEPSFPADPRAASRSSESGADARQGNRSAEGATGEGRQAGRNSEASAGESRRGGEASSGDARQGGRGTDSGQGRNGEASSGGRGTDSGQDARAGRSGEGGSGGRGSEAGQDSRAGGRSGEASSSDGRSGGRGAESSQDARSGRGTDATGSDGRQGGRNSDDDESSESRSSSRGGRNPRSTNASRGAEAAAPRGSSRAPAAQGPARSTNAQGENSTGGRARKGEPSGGRASSRNLPPSVSGLHTMPSTRATQPKPARSGPSSMMWMVILAVMGIVLGAGGGYAWLRIRQARAAKNATVPATPGAAAGTAGGLMATGQCPPGMKLVSGGTFKRGSTKEDRQSSGSSDELALESVMVGSFCVDEFEFPNKRGRLPRVSVSLLDAKSLCEAASKRLCSEDEWEKACKGPGNARYSRGEDSPTACNTGTATGSAATLAHAGGFPSCQHSEFLPSDMSGNAAEWTDTQFKKGGADMTIKGGSFMGASDTSRCAARKQGAPKMTAPDLGFRCCANVLP
ncbi:SUMF1/EgtB/PvdO family nonheme iron enzyme [Corallococcus sp. bb12-1]|uniref:protein kinase domain-containing protein n=1 Tax=Corallococcus sp. bb12-1 TaxID=2996784 RepID=UPI00226F2D7C|nr:SUMF1/EgtB/PvdO family nonheme iron enzyme [Corallococcus sp. bb12-1]MCY1043364.1 SUMF1/EgtB/PvdO family nonheme iron enzyme [Corallococcus sp. bb12-1]